MTTLAEALAFGQGLERPFNCPSEDHEDVHASASVNMALGVWFCFSCQSYGVVGDHVPSVEEALSILTGRVRPRVYAESWLDIYDAYQPSPYWAGRYGTEVAARFRCGTHPFTGNPTYPLRGPEGVRGVVQRQDGEPKYLYPGGVRISDTFFGLPIVPKSTVVLVEGASDVMAIHSSGPVPRPVHRNWSVLGCYGSGVHAPQVDLLRDAVPQLIVAAFDADQAGYAACERAVKTLSTIAPVITHDWILWGVNDPGDMRPGEAMSALRDTVGSHGSGRKKETAHDR